MMEKFVKIPVLLAVLIAVVCHSQGFIHKVRHKHQFDSRHVNEIRDAFDDYKNTIQRPKTPKVSFNDAIQIKSLRHHRKSNQKFSDDLTESASEDRMLRDGSSRYKRVHKSDTTTEKFSDNYDEEYDDSEDEKSLRVSGNSGPKVQETETAGQSLTNIKLETLGTRDSVKKSFELHNKRNNQQEIIDNYDQATIIKRIHENMMRTRIEGMCRWPNKKVIEMPQHASKMYTPRKYVIYKCSDDTACCSSFDQTCVAKKTEEIVLWFNVRHAGAAMGYESLKVQNHTECQCLHKSRQLTAQSRSGSSVHSRVSQIAPRTTTKRPSARQCRCPLHFAVEIVDGSCDCFCRNGQLCRQRYEGKEGFTISDQRCIKTRGCGQPNCLFGSYSTITGRCPDKNDKIRRGFQRPK